MALKAKSICRSSLAKASLLLGTILIFSGASKSEAIAKFVGVMKSNFAQMPFI